MNRSKIGTLLGALTLLFLVTVVTFFVARATVFDDGGIEAQSPPSGGPTPGPNARAAQAALDQDRTKPRFEGPLNGFVFFDPGKTPAIVPAPCQGLLTEDSTRDATKADIQSSPLNFTPTYLPSGMTLTFEGGNKCRGQVVAVVKNFGIQGGGQIAIMRVANTPQITAEAPADRLTPTTVASRPAVVEKPVFEGSRTAVYLRDEMGYWIVSGTHLSEAEVIRVAESVK